MSGTAPPVQLFGRAWSAAAVGTWIVPAGLLAAGALMVGVAQRCRRGLALAASPEVPERAAALSERALP